MSLLCCSQYEQTVPWKQATLDLKADQLLGLKPNTIAKYICFNDDEIRARQAMFVDFINNDDIVSILKQIKDNINSIKKLNEKDRKYYDSSERVFYEIRSFQVYMDTIDTLDALYSKKKDILCSRRLIDFLHTFHEIHESEDYMEICSCLIERLKSIENIKSVTIGINLNMVLEPSEVGILSINNYNFVDPPLFKKCLSSHRKERDFLSPLIKFESENNFLENTIYLTINKMLVKALKKQNETLSFWLRQNCNTLINVSEEIDFLCSCMDLLNYLKEKGGFWCYPICADTVKINCAYNPLLLRQKKFKDVVCNDIFWNFDESYIFVLTGANSGGKSVFVESVGICQILFQLGMPIPAKEACIKPVNCIHTHFSMSSDDGESRFTNECKKMRLILDSIRKNDMLLMDETFSATSSNEGAAIAYYVLKHIKKLSCICIYSTHIHDLIHYLPSINENSNAVIPMHVECVQGVRTFRIVYGADDESSHAYEIAKKYGLTDFEDE